MPDRTQLDYAHAEPVQTCEPCFERKSGHLAVGDELLICPQLNIVPAQRLTKHHVRAVELSPARHGNHAHLIPRPAVLPISACPTRFAIQARADEWAETLDRRFTSKSAKEGHA